MKSETNNIMLTVVAKTKAHVEINVGTIAETNAQS